MLIRISREDALKFGLLRCACGCRHNNHFDTGKCSRCGDCKSYREIPVIGEIVEEKPIKKKRLL